MKNIIEIGEDVRIGNILLEKGDKIEVLEEAKAIMLDSNSALLITNALTEFKRTKMFREYWTEEEWNSAHRLIIKAV